MWWYLNDNDPWTNTLLIGSVEGICGASVTIKPVYLMYDLSPGSSAPRCCLAPKSSHCQVYASIEIPTVLVSLTQVIPEDRTVFTCSIHRLVVLPIINKDMLLCTTVNPEIYKLVIGTSVEAM